MLRRASEIADGESDERWSIISQLHDRADRPALDAACALARSEDMKERVLGWTYWLRSGGKLNGPFSKSFCPWSYRRPMTAAPRSLRLP